MDNLVLSFGLQIDNGIPILDFTNNKDDRNLFGIEKILLIEVRNIDDVRDYNAAKVMGSQSSFVCDGLSLANQLVQQHIDDDTQQGIQKSASIVILTAGHDPKWHEALESNGTIGRLF